MTNDEIKVCFNQEPDWRTKCEVIKHFILSKTTQSIEYIEPCGDISHRLTFMFNRPVFDYEVCDYLYCASLNYFKQTIN